MILLVGSEGAQGKRYQAILRHLNRRYARMDLRVVDDFSWDEITHIILATPTANHVEEFRRFAATGRPILVEKPFSKHVESIRQLARIYDGYELAMVMQYRHLLRPGHEGLSYYNYFRHGSDGLAWDCLQTIAFAKGDVQLSETSPIWSCQINGQPLDISEMDGAYVTEVDEFLWGRRQSWDEIIAIHEKVERYAAHP